MKKIDIVVILGGGLDGTLKPFHYTKERLEAFFRAPEEIRKKPIIVSGAYSTWLKKKPRYTEAEIMQRFLVKNGIPRSQIFLERKSRDTMGNAYCSKQIIKKHPSWRHILVVTTDGHIWRSRWIFSKIFGKQYKIYFLPVPSRTLFHHPGRVDYEKYIVGIYKKWLNSVRDGDDRKIMELLKKFHPAYARGIKAEAIRKDIARTKKQLLGYTHSSKV